MSKHLITGGAGFIGSTLADRLLAEGSDVVILDNFCDFYDPLIKENNVKANSGNPKYKIYRNDIRDREAHQRIFDENEIDCIIHLAAMAGVRPSIENPVLYQEVNCLGTQNILEEARLHGVKNLVMASSSSVYGNCKETPFKESFIVDFAISPYAATKKANEVMAHVYHQLYDMNIILLRFFTVYGPRQRPDLAINKFTQKMLIGDRIEMFGDGSTSRDYTYVDDIVDGIARSINYVKNNNNVYEIMNLGSSNPIKLTEMISAIGMALNIDPNVQKMPMQPGDVENTYADISKANKLLGYKPKTNFNDGIKLFVDWYKGFN